MRDAAEGGRHGVHIVVEPGADSSLDDIVVVPRGKYDLIQMQGFVVPVKTPVRTRASRSCAAPTARTR